MKTSRTERAIKLQRKHDLHKNLRLETARLVAEALALPPITTIDSAPEPRRTPAKRPTRWVSATADGRSFQIIRNVNQPTITYKKSRRVSA